MIRRDHRARLDLAETLAAVRNAPPVAAADVVGRHLAAAIGATGVAFLIADFSGRALIRLGHSGTKDAARTRGAETAERVSLAGSPYGRAVLSQAIVVEPDSEETRLFAPVANRGEAIGVLEVALPAAPDEQTLADVALAAEALAYVVIAHRRFTDLYEWGQRSIPLDLAAEIQHRLLPGSYTCEASEFTLAGWLEPAGNIAGDTFDFALERDALHVSMTDAMGHSVTAALLATVMVSALRNARRSGAGLAEQADRANQELGKHAQEFQFVTGQIARIDLSSGAATIVNAGHPPPLRVRAGRIAPVPLAADPPFGPSRAHRYTVQRLPLQPGDRLMFLTDGMLERNGNADIESLLLVAAEMHPREAVQHLIEAVLNATGAPLKDDATALCLDWHGPRVA